MKFFRSVFRKMFKRNVTKKDGFVYSSCEDTQRIERDTQRIERDTQQTKLGRLTDISIALAVLGSNNLAVQRAGLKMMQRIPPPQRRKNT